MATRKLGPAIAAGCTTVLKPAGETPLSTLAFLELCKRVGLPAGVLNVVTTLNNVAEVGNAISTNPIIRKISLTGSTRVGKLIARDSADTLKKLLLELEGNSPVIIFDDANLDEAIEQLIVTKFRNGGQTCVAANRIFVQKKIEQEFYRRFSLAISSLKVGGDADPASKIGSLMSKNNYY